MITDGADGPRPGDVRAGPRGEVEMRERDGIPAPVGNVAADGMAVALVPSFV